MTQHVESASVYSHHSLVLRGQSAFDFLATSGWHATSSPDAFEFHADIVKNDDFVVCRYSHNQAEFTFELPTVLAGKERVMLLAGVEGELLLHSGNRSDLLSPGHILRMTPDSFTGASCPQNVSCMFVIHQGFDARALREPMSGPARSPYFAVLSSAAHSMLNSVARPSDPGFLRVQRAIAELARAASLDPALLSADPLIRLYQQATDLLECEAPDPRFDVASAAHRLGVSRSQLHRAFAAVGESPGLVIQGIRCRHAQELLEGGLSRDEAAVQSGFGSQKRMLRAFSSSANA
ncbi:helix-turn-helix domain-containing protein [Pseudoclavibacter sp. VKM Ac-2888]|uniref:helix-turn-helix domain-containing protein n=1 Tax=Pseudoclavibacter sp. VKM Ac-2888 TaxID=2783830 RepID=UPI00188C4F62|nr:AraC family transcriptional regulator [Pseudoclavibacter sp. VKM Ac-2888]MBF4549407.1 helix-turn-helix transcriptional regulator [Pseudoclavibacter sp. VKM Ac-2888]